MKRFSALILILLLCIASRAGATSFSDITVIPPALNGTQTASDARSAAYSVYIQDDADLMTDEEEQRLLGVMEGLLPRANVAFLSTRSGSGSTSQKALDYRDNILRLPRQIPLILLIIDMQNREIYLFSQGEVEKVVTRSNATAITEEAAVYLKKGNYYLGAEKAFDLTKDLFVTRTVSSPMRLAAALIAAPALGLLAAAMVMLRSSHLHSAARVGTEPKGQGKLRITAEVQVLSEKRIRTTTERIPSSSGGSSCSSCGGSSCSSCGGSSCGSGGGSSF
ncbi:MAG: TPM domain-containing protein [Clostridia bacterium]|nr:TPM domain-containing protein [Clostridia bacterium]